MMYYHEGSGMDDAKLARWITATLARLTETNAPPWRDATSERTEPMTETAETGAWFPEPGDVVTFTALPSNALNRGKRYVITSVTGNKITYKPEWVRNWLPRQGYADRLGNLWLRGMAKEERQP